MHSGWANLCACGVKNAVSGAQNQDTKTQITPEKK